MAAPTLPLTQADCEQAAPRIVDGKPKPRVLSLGDGLLLQVAPSTVDAKGDYSTSKQWLYRYSLDGHERRYGLGPFDPANKAGMNLDRARIKAMLLREQVAQGIDPLERKHEQREERERRRLARRTTGKTLQEVAEEFIAMQAPRWSSGVTDQWRDTMKRLVYPFIGKIPVAKVTDEDVLRVLEALWARNVTNTGREICKYLYRIFGYAIARKYRTLANPAVWKNGLEHALAKPRKAEPRPALDYRHMPAFMAKLRQEPGDNARCLEFVILTGVRSNEAREATWGEIDLAERMWTIPKKRVKMRRDHKVPLSGAAVALLQAIKGADEPDSTALVFKGRWGGLLSEHTGMLAVLRRLGVKETVHGMRSSLRTWAADTAPEYPREVAEACLGHFAGGVEGIYNRADFIELRRGLLEKWAAHCAATEPANVVPLRRTA